MHKSGDWIKIGEYYFRKDTIILIRETNTYYDEQQQQILQVGTIRNEHNIKCNREEIDRIYKELKIKL